MSFENKNIVEIAKKVSFEIVNAQRWNIVAIALVGSAARGEETILGGRFMSDLDLMVITKILDPFLEARINETISGIGGEVPYEVSVGCVPVRNLKNHRSLAIYEAKKNGIILLGDGSIFDRLVEMEMPEDIPSWEGMRLLLNRIFELLQSWSSSHAKDRKYGVAKSYLAIGEAYLVFEARYAASYGKRLLEIERECDFDVVEDFVEKFRESTNFKLNMSDKLSFSWESARRDLTSAIDYFLGEFLKTSAPLKGKMERLHVAFHHPYHSLAFFLRKLLRGGLDLGHLKTEPCIKVWTNGIKLLNSQTKSRKEVESAIREWKRVPQFIISEGILGL